MLSEQVSTNQRLQELERREKNQQEWNREAYTKQILLDSRLERIEWYLHGEGVKELAWWIFVILLAFGGAAGVVWAWRQALA